MNVILGAASGCRRVWWRRQVERMLDPSAGAGRALHKQLPKAKTPHESEALQRQIAFTDRQIDELVYELYGLTKDEIRVVEGAANG